MHPREFLLGETVGDSVLNFSGFNWNPLCHGESESFKDLFLRFERRHDGKIALTEILTPETERLFGGTLGQFQAPGHAFSNMEPLVLKVFLRAAFGQIVQGKR